DAAGRERLQHTELLGDFQCAVVRQHHAGAADADARRARRDRGHQHLGRAADDGRQAVVFADPEAAVAEALAMLGQVERVADRSVFGAAGDGNGLIEYRESQGHADPSSDAYIGRSPEGTRLAWGGPARRLML